MIIPEEVYARWFAYESSPVDWCEDNFTVSPHVAEFTNTLSNALMIAVPLITLRLGLWDSYVTHVSCAPRYLLLWQACVGLGSCFFHGTLSLLGQFSDEIPLIWCLLMLYVFCIPRKHLPNNVSQAKLNVFICLYGFFVSLMWIYNAHLFAFLIWPTPLPLLAIVLFEAHKNEFPEIRKVCNFTLLSFLGLLVIWMIDKFHCETVKSYGLPGIHNIFHIFIGFNASNVVSILSFWKAKGVTSSDTDVSLRFRYYVIPYVLCENKLKT